MQVLHCMDPRPGLLTKETNGEYSYLKYEVQEVNKSGQSNHTMRTFSHK